MNFKWERIAMEVSTSKTYRAKVIGGWIIKDEAIEGDARALVFVADIKHEWEIYNFCKVDKVPQ